MAQREKSAQDPVLAEDFLKLKNPHFRHLIDHQKQYLFILLLLVLGAALFSNSIDGVPILKGGESYFHYLSSDLGYVPNITHYVVSFFSPILGPMGMAILPLLIAIASFFLFYRLAENISLPERFTFFFMLFLILTPAFILSYSTLSAYSIFILFTLLGFLLLYYERNWLRVVATFFFVLATFVDVFSSLLLVTLHALNISWKKRNERRPYYIMISVIAAVAAFNALFLQQEFILGPFHTENLALDFISDLGGLSGISFFMVLLSIIGLTVTWKRKRLYLMYAFVPLLLLGYFMGSHTIFYVALVSISFAAIGFIKLFEVKWELRNLKAFTAFILILGVVFSLLSYIDRIDSIGPSQEEIQTLQWIQENTPRNSVVLSDLENSYYITSIAERTAYEYPHSISAEDRNSTVYIFNATYVTQLFPLLEAQQVDLVYITKHMKESLPEDQGFLFLLQNERFKLVHSSGETEVWTFTEGGSS